MTIINWKFKPRMPRMTHNVKKCLLRVLHQQDRQEGLPKASDDDKQHLNSTRIVVRAQYKESYLPGTYHSYWKGL
jgi:hypothetical protein